MIFYLSLFLICALPSFLLRRQQLYFLYLFCGIFVFIIGFRYEVGGDWSAYLLMKESIQAAGIPIISIIAGGGDPAYILLNYIAPYSWHDKGMSFVNFVCAIFFMWGIFVFCKKQPKPLFSFALALPYLIIVVGMGYTRQSAAIGFALMAFTAFTERRFRLYILCVLAAALFHMSAVVMFLLLLAKISSKNFFRYSLLIFIVFVLSAYFLQERILAKLGTYGSNELVDSAGAIYRVMMNFIPALLFLFYRRFFRRYFADDLMYKTVFLLSVFSLFFAAGVFFLTTLTDRFALYFSIIQLIVYPVFLYKFAAKDRRIVQTTVIFGYTVFFIVWLNFSAFAQNSWIPYRNYLFL